MRARGIGPAHRWLVDDLLADERLQVLLPDYSLPSIPLNMLVVPERADIVRVRLLADFLAKKSSISPELGSNIPVKLEVTGHSENVGIGTASVTLKYRNEINYPNNREGRQPWGDLNLNIDSACLGAFKCDRGDPLNHASSARRHGNRVRFPMQEH